MIESGSFQPGVDVAAWRLPEGTALRYERPTASLRPWFRDYAVLDSDITVFTGPSSWLLPIPPKIWLTLTAPDVSIETRIRRPVVLGAAMLLGPLSAAAPVESHGGVSIVIDPTPRGYARLFAGAALDLRDRIAPLDQHRPPKWTEALLECLHAGNRGTDVKGALDTFLTAHLPPPGEDEELVDRIERVIADDDGFGEVATWHEQVGLRNARTLARVCERYFGYGPKLLQRRRRFLHVFTPMMMATDPVDHRAVPAGYHDVPHFLRDARAFLGMTAKQFLDMGMLYQRAALRAREQVLGSPHSLLDQPASATHR